MSGRTAQPRRPYAESDLIMQLAEAVAAGQSARYLHSGPDGKKVAGAFTSIEDAARSGLPFMVRPKPTALAVDADSERQVAALARLASAIEESGFPVVVVDSGRGRHLWSRMPVAWVRRWTTEARLRGLDPRGRSWIRPPLSPHPAGLKVRLVDIDPTNAVSALSTTPKRSGTISRRIRELLRHGDPEGRYQSGSEAVQAVAAAYANAGLSFTEFHRDLSDPENELSTVPGRRPDPHRWLRNSWDKAVAFVAANPLEDTALALESVVDQVLLVVSDTKMNSTTFAVLSAHIDSAWSVGSPVHVLGAEQCAVDAGVTKKTVISHRRRLVAEGLLERVAGGGGKEAGVWRLGLPPDIENDLGRLYTPTNSHPPNTEIRGVKMRRVGFDHDAFRWGALGKTARLVIDVLRDSNGVPVPISTVMAELPVPVGRGALNHTLNRLRQARIAYPSEGGLEGWILVNDSPEALGRLADERGTSGRRNRQIQQLEADRELRNDQRQRFRRNSPECWTVEYDAIDPYGRDPEEQLMEILDGAQ